MREMKLNMITIISSTKAASIRAGFLVHLDREAARFTARAAQVAARRDALAPPSAVSSPAVRLRAVRS